MSRALSVAFGTVRLGDRARRLLRALVDRLAKHRRNEPVPAPVKHRLPQVAARPTLSSRVDGRRWTLDLAPVRDKMGKHWPRYADAVLQLAEKVIGREVGPKDRYTRSGDGFLVLFDFDSGPRADFAIQRIEKTLIELLFGTGDMPDEASRQPAPSAQPIAARRKPELRHRLSRLAITLDSLRSMRVLTEAWPTNRSFVHGGRPPKAPEAHATGTWTSARSATQRWWHAKRHGPSPKKAVVEAPQRLAKTSKPTAPPETPAARPSAELEFVDRDAAPQPSPTIYHAPPMMMRPSSGNEERIRLMEDAILSATLRTAREYTSFQPAVEAALRRVRFSYHPSWHVSSRALVIYRCTPTLIEGDRIVEGDAVLPNRMSNDLIAVLDQLTLANVALDVEALVAKKRDVMFVVPIHITSFTDEWTTNALLKLCHHIPPAGRPRVIFEVMDAAQARTDAKCRTALKALKPFCHRFGAMMPLTSRDFRFWREIGFSIVTVDAAEWRGTEPDLVLELERYQQVAHREGLRTSVSGLKSRSLILAAATMGYDFVHGDTINHAANLGDFTKVPFDFGDLYMNELEKLLA